MAINPTQRMLILLNITGNELGVLLGVIHQTISQRKRGKIKTPVEDCIKISKQFNLSLEYLLTGEDEGAEVVYNISESLHKALDNGNYHTSAQSIALLSKELYQLVRYHKDIDLDSELTKKLNLLKVYTKE